MANRLRELFRRSANQVNRPIPEVVRSFSFCERGLVYNYSDAYLWMIVNKVFNGLRNVNFKPSDTAKGNASIEINRLCCFFENNITTLTWLLWKYGYVAVGFDAARYSYFIPDYSKIKKDRSGMVVDYDFVVYADSYVSERRSLFDIIGESLKNINRMKNADTYLTQTFGAFAVMSGKTIPVSPADKEDMQKSLKNDYGITPDKYQILLMSQDVNLQQLNMPIKDLDLGGKVKEEAKVIAGVMNVPYDLVPISGQSTYANQEQAIKTFYSDCISPIAETMLSLIRYIVSVNYQWPSYFTTFSIDNVPELEDDRMADVEYKLKLVELAERMEKLGIDAEEIKKQL